MPEGITADLDTCEISTNRTELACIPLSAHGPFGIIDRSAIIGRKPGAKRGATGMPFQLVTVLLAVIALSYSLFSGIKASMLTDAIQMVLCWRQVQHS